jgi:Fur family transcriptional regulator, zinc uptake regulator
MYVCHQHHECITNALANAEAFCSAQHLRFTHLRKQVLSMVMASHRPVKAYTLLEQLQTEDDSAKPPTIYRSLDFLIEHGLIHRIHSLNAYVGCTHPHQHASCYFTICTTCEQVSECCHHTLYDALQQSTVQEGFVPQHVSVEITGTCRACQQAAMS